MSFVVYQTNKKTGMKYAYLQEAYRDPVTKRPKSKRTYLGRVDPVTNQIIDKATDGKRNRTKLGTDAIEQPTDSDVERKYETLLKEQQLKIQELQKQVSDLQKQMSGILKDAKKASAILNCLGQK